MEKDKLHVWLDDMVPAPVGWLWIKTGEELLDLILAHASPGIASAPRIIMLAMDHDLGEGQLTGYDLLKLMLDGIYSGALAEHLMPTSLIVMSGNPVGTRSMTLQAEDMESLLHWRVLTLSKMVAAQFCTEVGARQ